jgi:hypothetical protein
MTEEGKQMKGYIVGYKSRESANHEIIDYWFSTSPKDALRRPTRELAEAEIFLFNRGITINADLQRPHLLNDFQVEEFEDGFVVWCEGPFVVRARGEGAAENAIPHTPPDPSAPQP